MCPLCGKDCELVAHEQFSIMVLSWMEQATSAKQTWICLPLCSPLESSGSNPLLNMILSGLITWSSTKHKPRPGRTSPHLGQTTLSKPFLPPMTPPQDQMAYPMLHGGFTLVLLRKLWLHILTPSVDQLSPPVFSSSMDPESQNGSHR